MTTIDPRIRARRIAVRREEGRRRLRFLIWCAAGLAVLGAGVVATRSPLLDVDTVEVSGDVQTGRRQTLEALGVAEGDLMLEVDPGAAARRLERLPWIASATVRRQFPSTVTVVVVERRVAAAVPAAGERWALVDATGHVIDVLVEPPPDIVRVLGVRPVTGAGDRLPAPARDALTVAGAVPPPLRPRVPEVVSGPHGLELRLTPQGVVRFGPAAAVGPKFQALATLLERVDLADVAVIDLRVPDAPVLTRA
jgi:cell division protein FtsQ